MERYRLGEDGYIRVLNYDAAGELVDCDTGYPALTLYDPAGTVIVDAVAMTKSETGDYYYEPSLPATSPAGSWYYSAEHQTDSKVTHSEGTLEVV